MGERGSGSKIKKTWTDPISAAVKIEYRYPLLYADITLKVISDEALQVVQNVPVTQTGFASWADYIAANSEVLTRRVNFLARPL